MHTYGFIGTGNMGGALIRAAAKAVDPKTIMIMNRGRAKAEKLAEETQVVIEGIQEIAANCTYIFLGVKPQMMAGMLDTIKKTLSERTDRFILVSMAAGLTMKAIADMAGGSYPVIRINPNLPAAVGEGMTMYCSEDVSEAEMQEFLQLMQYSGKLIELAENQMDAAASVAGCGPAFVSMFIEGLADGGVRCGLPRAAAMQMAEQMVLGTAKMLMETGKHPAVLKDEVCSPGGTTIAGVIRLEEGSFSADAANAVICAYNRTLELKK